MANHHSSASQAGAGRWREVMGKERDRDHVVRQGSCSVPDVPATCPLFVNASSLGPGVQGTDRSRLFLLPSYYRPDSSGSQDTSNDSREAQRLGVHSVPTLPSEQHRLDCPDGDCDLGPFQQQNKPDGQFLPSVLLPASGQKKDPVCLPVVSSQPPAALSSLPLRSPKRTISFDFPNTMDPRRMEQIHRQIIRMAHEAGISDSVKIVEEEEPLPIIQLQDPPKPKFKRQLSADNSPPDKLSAAAAAPGNSGGKEHVHQGQRTRSLADPTTARPSDDKPLGLSPVRGVHGEGCSYTASGLSPKRLKSDHGQVSCTPPRSPLVKQVTTQRDDIIRDNRGAQADNEQTDVVHIFPQHGGGMNEDNNNAAKTTREKNLGQTFNTSDNTVVDETDARNNSKSEMSTDEVVSVLNVQPPKRADTLKRNSRPSCTHIQTAAKPQESMRTLQMLFRPKGDTLGSENEDPSSKVKEPDFDRRSVTCDTGAESWVVNQTICPRADRTSPKTDRPEVTTTQTADKDCMQSTPQKVVTSSPPQPNTSAEAVFSASPQKRTPQRKGDSPASDPYVAELAGRLQDMQRMIFSQHMTQPGETSAQKEENEMDMTTATRQTQITDRERLYENVTPASNVSSNSSAITAASQEPSEESRTARLCQSKSNPFIFSTGDIEKAQATLSSSEPASLTNLDTSGRRGRENAVYYPDVSKTLEQSWNERPFRLGELYISSFKAGQMNALLKQRQLSDPGNFNLPPMNVSLDKVKPIALRQFSEPAGPQDPSHEQEIDQVKKKIKQSSRSLQQHIRFMGETCEGIDVLEGYHSSFPRDEEKETNDPIWRKCAKSQAKVLNQKFLQCTPANCCEVSKRHQPFDNSSTHERTSSRDHEDLFQQFDKQSRLHQSPEERSAILSDWVHSPRQRCRHTDRAYTSVRQPLEDDSVFEDVGSSEWGSQFKSPATTVDSAGRFLDRSADRSSSSLLSAGISPRRPALRSQSNVEQSPNQAELEAMAHCKYLRSFSEHISDPQRLIEQLRAMPPADCDQLLEQLQGMRRVASSTSFNSDNDSSGVTYNRRDGRHRGVRRTLFQDADESVEGGYELAEWQQQGCYTYPPPLARRQSVHSARELRRSQSWIRDMENACFNSSGTRSRNPGDLDVKLECTQATAAMPRQLYREGQRTVTAQHPEILRVKIETYIQQILKSHLQIPPSGTSQADMDQWIAQAREIERLTQEASQLMETLSEHNRSVYDVLTGSVVIKVNCTTLLGVLDLWENFKSGVLQSLVDKLFAGDRLLAVTGLGDVKMEVSLCYHQYTACLEELGEGDQQPAQTHLQSLPAHVHKHKEGIPDTKLQDSPYVPPTCYPTDDATPCHAQELMTSPTQVLVSAGTSCAFTPSKPPGKTMDGDWSARKAFSELNLSDGELTPTSQTSKKFFDNVQKENLVTCPRISPRTNSKHLASFSDVMAGNDENAT